MSFITLSQVSELALANGWDVNVSWSEVAAPFTTYTHFTIVNSKSKAWAYPHNQDGFKLAMSRIASDQSNETPDLPPDNIPTIFELLLAGDYKAKGAVYDEPCPDVAYIHSAYFGTSVKHLLTFDTDTNDLIIDEIRSSEKYQHRVRIETREIAPLLRFAMQCYTQIVHQDTAYPDTTQTDESLGDLDDHPF